MSGYVYAPDGATPAKTPGNAGPFLKVLPAEHWVDTTPPGGTPEGYFVELTVGNAVSFGYYPFINSPTPQDNVRSGPSNQGDGTFDWVFTFSQTLQDDRLANEARDAKYLAVENAVATLRTWAVEAASTNVTNGNNTAVTQTMVNRLGVFFDRFADLIESRQ